MATPAPQNDLSEYFQFGTDPDGNEIPDITVRIPEYPATHSDNIRPPVPGYPATCDALP